MARQGFRFDEGDGEASGLTTWCEIDKDNTADYHHSDNTLDYHCPVRGYNLYRQKNVQTQEAVFDPGLDLKVHKFMDKVKKGRCEQFHNASHSGKRWILSERIKDHTGSGDTKDVHGSNIF